jgi:capping protein beta
MPVTAVAAFLPSASSCSYFEGGVSSVYFWDLDDGGFAACFLVKKDVTVPRRFVSKGCWDSIHVVEVHDRPSDDKKSSVATLKLTSTVMLSMTVDKPETGNVNLAGSLTRQAESTGVKVTDANPLIAVMGRMIEDMEIGTTYPCGGRR